MVELTERDYQVLWYAWQCRYISARQLNRLFWLDAGERATRLRLEALTAATLLTRATFRVLSENVRTLYCPTLHGNRALVEAKWLAAKYEQDFPRRPKGITDGLEHDLFVNDIRIAFEETGAIPKSWVSDHELRQNQSKVGNNRRTVDGTFEWSARGSVFQGVLEYEHKPYNAGRWPDILNRLRFSHPDQAVFLVVRTKDRLRTVSKQVNAAKIFSDRPEGFLLCDFPSVKNNGLAAGFVNLDGDPFPLVDNPKRAEPLRPDAE